MSDVPLISCVMPTARRRDFLAQSIAYFQAQDYPNKELVIVEDGEISNWDLARGRDNVGYHYIPGTHTIGAARNLACSIARGEIICHWEDDDIFGPHRLSKQVAPLLAHHAEATAMKMSLVFDQQTGTYWRCSDEEHARLFAHDVRSGTLMYWASAWRLGLRYKDCSRGEDVAFLEHLLACGHRLAQVVDPASYICVRHAHNTTDTFTYDEHWTQVEPG